MHKDPSTFHHPLIINAKWVIRCRANERSRSCIDTFRRYVVLSSLWRPFRFFCVFPSSPCVPPFGSSLLLCHFFWAFSLICSAPKSTFDAPCSPCPPICICSLFHRYYFSGGALKEPFKTELKWSFLICMHVHGWAYTNLLVLMDFPFNPSHLHIFKNLIPPHQSSTFCTRYSSIMLRSLAVVGQSRHGCRAYCAISSSKEIVLIIFN